MKSLGEFEDAYLHEFRDSEIFEAAVLHALDEVGRDFEDSYLDKFIEIGLIAHGTNLLHFVGVDALNFEGDELVGVWLFIAHCDEAPGVGGIDFEDAQGNEVVDGDAADLGLLQRAGIAGCDIEEGVGLEFFGIEAGETEFGHAVDEGGIGGEDGVAAKFVIVDGASAGKRTGFSGEACRVVGAIVCEVGVGDAGEAVHGFIAEIHAAVVITHAIIIADVQREFIGSLADSNSASGMGGGKRLCAQGKRRCGEDDGESDMVSKKHT